MDKLFLDKVAINLLEDLFVLEINNKGKILYCNKYFEKYLGFYGNSIINKYYTCIYNKNIKKSLIKEIYFDLSKKRKWEGLIEWIDNDKNIFCFNTYVFMNTSNNYIVIGIDVSIYKKERREFRKKVLLKIKEKNIIIYNNLKIKNNLKESILNVKNENIRLKEDKKKLIQDLINKENKNIDKNKKIEKEFRKRIFLEKNKLKNKIMNRDKLINSLEEKVKLLEDEKKVLLKKFNETFFNFKCISYENNY